MMDLPRPHRLGARADSWGRFPARGRPLEPALGCLNKLAKWEMPAKPPHYVRLPLNEESREKLNSRLRHLIRELLLKRRRCRSDQEKYTL